MLYRQKKDTYIRKIPNGCYICTKETFKERVVDESGAVFLGAITRKPQTIDEIVDKLLKIFIGVDKDTILPDAIEFYDGFVKEGFLVKGETEDDLEKADRSFLYDTNDLSKIETINFYLPGFDLQYQGFYRLLLDFMKKYPYRFMSNIKIPALYGSFNNMIWNGGRIRLGKQASLQEMKDAIKNYNDSGVAVRYTYTNSAIQEKHLQDTLCNLSMELANNGKNEVLVNSSILETYLRKTYPNFKYILSTTTCERDVGKINEATKKYDLVVIDYRDNKNESFLKKIEDKNKIEILIDEKCPSKCPNRKLDYQEASEKNCFLNINEEEKNFFCMRSKADVVGFYEGLRFNPDTNLTFNDIYGKYYDMGFRHFKFLGRNEADLLTAFESYIYYMTVPECRDATRYELMNYYSDYLINEFGGNRKNALDYYEKKLKGEFN